LATNFPTPDKITSRGKKLFTDRG